MKPPIETLAGLARQRDGQIDPAADSAARRRLEASLARERGWSAQVPRRAVALAAALAVAAVLALLLWPAPALDVVVDGQALAEAGYVEAKEAPVALSFSDGTRIDFAAGSAGRVVSVDAHGAQLSVERGQAHFAVMHLPEARWSVTAGPFTVAVTGTEFDLAWGPDEQQLTVDLHQGSVEVRGAMLDTPIAIRGGKRLIARVQGGDVQLRDLRVAEQVPTSTAPEPSVQEVAEPRPGDSASRVDGAPTTAPSATTAPPARKLSWAELIAKGDYATVLSEAEARGIESVLQSGSAGDLVALADAARYQGKGPLARTALVALREHHPGSAAATSAAFLLGRMSEGSAASAIGWYDRYLAEAPGGAYASEALGRKLYLLSKSNPAAAKVLARQYLAAYPSGPYAPLARSLNP
ncbi:MAG: FecR domain-containing protein [Polyangiaceae bacterium]